MRPRDAQLYQNLCQGLQNCQQHAFPLAGVQSPIQCNVFLKQLVDSIRRVQFVSVVTNRNIHPNRANGLSVMFDPIRAAMLNFRAGDLDEACWLAFLFVHFGRHPVSGYRYTREFYGALGQQDPWTFNTVAGNIPAMKDWLDQNEAQLRRGKSRGFGNHRKYLSLSGSKKNGTGHAFETYVRWVRAFGSHDNLFAVALHQSGNSPEAAFEWLYKSMGSVASFGRIGKFDYLTMLQKLGFANIKPGRPYLDASTAGPNKGARIMFDQHGVAPLSISDLENRVQVLGGFLGVGMQEMEDALCNWGKNPNFYRYFRG
jgi:Alpha-glutamyl/putrescinyl thymine pyrophosphorylase clade 3